MKCKTCEHQEQYNYYCQYCKSLPGRPDNYTPIEPKSMRNMPHPRQEQDPDEPYYNKDGRV